MNYQLYQGDCLEVMPTLEDNSIDAIIADLPYGITACKWDSVIPLEPLWEQYKRLIKPRGAVVLFGSQPFTSMLVMSNPAWFKYEWVWEKSRGSNFANAKRSPLRLHESVIIFGDGVITYNPIMRNGSAYDTRINTTRKPNGIYGRNLAGIGNEQKQRRNNRYPDTVIKVPSMRQQDLLHPTQKPIKLLEYLIRTYTNPGDLVLDNVFGSCTTGVACLNTGRLFIGIEKDGDYFQIGKDRMDKRAAELRMEYVQPKATEPIDTLPLFQEAGQ